MAGQVRDAEFKAGPEIEYCMNATSKLMEEFLQFVETFVVAEKLSKQNEVSEIRLM